jgi:hypothetical protein
MSTTQDLLQSLCDLHRIEKELNAKVKATKKSIALLELELMRAMDNDGITETGNKAIGKVVLSESVYPQVENWDEFGDYIITNRYIHLLERRPAVLAYRELLNLGRVVPGTLPFTKRKLSFKES